MLEGITEGVGIGSLSAGTLLLVVVLMVLTGKLVTRRQLEDVQREKEYWRTAHGVSEEARRMQSQQMQELLEANRTTRAVLHALPSTDADGQGGSGTSSSSGGGGSS